MINLSFWEKDAILPDPDITVIGSGIVGLNAAIRLQELRPGARIYVLERGPFQQGASTRNAGFACFGSPSELLADLAQQSDSAVLSLVDRRWKGLQRLRQRLGDERLSYQENGGYEVFGESDKARYQSCLDQLDRLNGLLAPVIGSPKTFLPLDHRRNSLGLSAFSHMIFNPHEGQLHPAYMMNGFMDLAREKGIRIFNGLMVKELISKGSRVEILLEAGYRINSSQVLVATNGFARQLLPGMDVQAVRNQVIITDELPDLSLKGCFHMDQGYVYFRNVGNRVLLGGFRNLDPEGETTDQFGFSRQIQQALVDLLSQKILPHTPFSIAHQWSGILGVGSDKRPIMKEVKPGIWVAIRLGGMGVALGSLLGEEAAEAMSEA